jgi:hypothetical protein
VLLWIQKNLDKDLTEKSLLQLIYRPSILEKCPKEKKEKTNSEEPEKQKIEKEKGVLDKISIKNLTE